MTHIDEYGNNGSVPVPDFENFWTVGNGERKTTELINGAAIVASETQKGTICFSNKVMCCNDLLNQFVTVVLLSDVYEDERKLRTSTYLQSFVMLLLYFEEPIPHLQSPSPHIERTSFALS